MISSSENLVLFEELDENLVLFEGLDLTGKSTLCKSVSERLVLRGLSPRTRRNNLNYDNPIGKIVKKYCESADASPLESAALFLASHLLDAATHQTLRPGEVHIQDSSWIRTISYNTMVATPIVPELADELFGAHPVFGKVFYLTANIADKQQRLLKREQDNPGSNTTGDYLCFRDPGFVEEHDLVLEALVKKYFPSYTRINTSEVSEEQALGIVIDELAQKS
jgi:thymidylate kinase